MRTQISNKTEPLLRHPELLPGESFPSYLIRLAKANFCEPNTLLFSYLFRTAHKNTRYSKEELFFPNDKNIIQTLTIAANLDVLQIYNASYQKLIPTILDVGTELKSSKVNKLIFYNTKSPTFSKHLHSLRKCQYCPLCLKEHPYHKLIWMPFLSNVCLKHRCLLLKSCTNCEKDISVIEIIENKCFGCNISLSEFATLSIIPSNTLFSQKVIQSLLTGENTDSLNFDFAPHKSPNILFLFISHLYNFINGKNLSQTKLFNDIKINNYEDEFSGKMNGTELILYNKYCNSISAFEATQNWPYGFYNFLEIFVNNSAKSCNKEKVVLRSSLRDFKEIYLIGYNKIWEHSEFDYIRKAFEEYVINNVGLSHGVQISTFCRKNSLITDKFKYINFDKAAEILGSTPTKVSNFVDTGKLKLYSPNKLGNVKTKFVKREEVDTLKTLLKRLLTLSAAASVLGVSEEILLGLVEQNLIIPKFSPKEGFLKWKFAEKDVFDFLAKIKTNVFEIGQEATNKSDGTSKFKQKYSFIQTCQKMAIVDVNGSSLISYLCQGKISAFHPKYTKFLVSNLQFSSDGIDNLINFVKINNNWVERRKVQRMLKVKDKTINYFVNKGLLNPISCGSAQYFTQSNIDMFLANYLTTNEAAKQLGITKITVQKWIRRGELKVISGPEIDGRHAYLIVKDDLMKGIEEKITFGEAMEILKFSKSTLYRWVESRKITPIRNKSRKQNQFYRNEIMEIASLLKR